MTLVIDIHEKRNVHPYKSTKVQCLSVYIVIGGKLEISSYIKYLDDLKIVNKVNIFLFIHLIFDFQI